MILLVGGLCALSVFFYTLKTGISPAPTSPRVRRAFLAQLPREVEGPIYELGCGWGGLAQGLAKQYSKREIIACEVSPLPYLVARLRAIWTPNLTVIRTDFFKRSLVDASLVVCYLCPKLMARLKPKFAKELTPGAWVASHTFGIRGWEALREVKADDFNRTPVYIYAAN